MTDNSLLESLRAMARDVLSAKAEQDAGRFRYQELQPDDASAPQHRLERIDLTPRIGIAVIAQRRQRPEGELVRRALIDGELITSSAMTIFGASAEAWKVQAWVDELEKADPKNWR